MRKSKRVLIVLAHPEPRSFNAQWARATAGAAEAAGQDVIWSDLYEMGFDPVEAANHYPADETARFDVLERQDEAARHGKLPGDVASEIDKIWAAATVIFHFPMWWFGPPAILKGWFDRVLVHNALHTSTRRFDSGLCSGKRSLFCVTTGSSAAESSPYGREGNVNLLLWPLAFSLRYLGFTILKPKTIHGVHGFKKGAELDALTRKLDDCLAEQSALIAGLDKRAAWKFNHDHAFGPDGRLNPGEPCYWPFIKPRPAD